MSGQDTGNVHKEDSGSQAAPPKMLPKKAPRTQAPKPLPPWKVILHNDDVNERGDVIQIVRKLTPLNEDEAIQCTLTADQEGLALILVTHRERAELYVEQFTSFKLTVTAEADI